MRPHDHRLRFILMAGLLGSALLLGACTRESGATATATGARGTPSPSRSAAPSAGQSAAPSAVRSTAPASTAPPPASTAPVVPPPASVAPASTAPVTGQKYVVEPGDTLSTIAEKFGVTVQQLIDTNRISNPDLVVVGQELTIPGR